jgi:thiamine pyridinylase
MIFKNFFLVYFFFAWMGFFGTPSISLAKDTTSLKVALYPYVPESRELFSKLEQVFEAKHPEVNLQLIESHLDSQSGNIISLSEDYYNGGLLKTQADVYEIDTVLLQAMIEAKKIQPIELPDRRFVPSTYKAITFDKKIWGTPHWVCGNFLFYKKDDLAIKNASSLNELTDAFKQDEPLFIDLKGKSTLGEWYLTGLAASDGNRSSLIKKIQSKRIDSAALKMVNKLLSLCPSGYCRSDQLHSRVGFYAREFARGKARAYIGYSESLHYALQEIKQNCGSIDSCLDENEIAVREIPALTSKGKQVGWTDVLSLSSDLPPDKKKLAMQFINFLTSWEGFRLVLNPEKASAPRYLLPALVLSKNSPELKPPLYSRFYDAYESRIILNSKDLNKTLRSYGKVIDCVLPGDHLDSSECHGVKSSTTDYFLP